MIRSHKEDARMIYVDMDDVLCKTTQAFLSILGREFGKWFTYDQLTTFDLEQACGLTPQELSALFHIAHQPDELLRLDPIDRAIPILKQWVTDGYDIAIVTGRPPSTYEPSVAWLSRHHVPYHSFMIVDKYGRHNMDKTTISLDELAQHRFCLAVEDSLAMALYLTDTMATPVSLFDCPWNQMTTPHPKITRCHHWQEIARTVPRE